MDASEIREIVVECLRYLQTETADRNKGINDQTRPIPDLGFVSEDGVDFACELSDRTGIQIPDDLNPFTNDAGNRALNVREIVTLVLELQSAAEADDA